MNVKIGKKKLTCSFEDNCDEVTLSLVIHRETYDGKTFGKIFANNDLFGYTIEPIVRPNNVIVKGNTALIAGTYEVELVMNARANQCLPTLKDVNKTIMCSKDIARPNDIVILMDINDTCDSDKAICDLIRETSGRTFLTIINN